jgi:hypothetical protein
MPEHGRTAAAEALRADDEAGSAAAAMQPAPAAVAISSPPIEVPLCMLSPSTSQM